MMTPLDGFIGLMLALCLTFILLFLLVRVL